MTERRGTKALELWCRRITDGYPGVNVQNMTTSWRDGLAFCAMIHHFRPDLIDFDSLNKDAVYGNNELAFRTAAEHLGIPALLDAEDMASCSVPDRLSILTYLSQFYQCFGGSSPSRLALSGTKESASEAISPVPESAAPKVGPRVGMRRDACAVCGMPIFLAEKLVISRTAYHRTCFRCARCENQLTPGNYYETEEGEYCCETCPDEEGVDSGDASMSAEKLPVEEETRNGSVENRQESLSDEEKTVQLMKGHLSREISSREISEKSEISQSAQMRLTFINDHLLTETNNEAEMTSSRGGCCSLEKDRRGPIGGSPISSTIGDVDVAEIVPRRRDGSRPKSVSPDDGHLDINEFSVSDVAGVTGESVDSTLRLEFSHDYDYDDDKEAKEGKDEKEASLESGENTVERDTKDTVRDVEPGARKLLDDVPDDDEPLSLVQRRLRIFESARTQPPRRESFRKPSREEEVESPTPESSAPDSTVPEEDIAKASEDSSPSPLAVVESHDRSSGGEAVTILTASGIDLSREDENYPQDLNPFADDDGDEEAEDSVPDRPKREKAARISTNPFGSSEDEDERETRRTPRPAERKFVKKLVDESPKERANVVADAEKPPTKRVLKAPRINLNPFWSDEDEDDDDEDEDETRYRPRYSGTPVPRPRTIKQTTDTLSLSSWRNDSRRSEMYTSNGSLASTGSSATPGGTCRKKKPAPPPPPAGIPKRNLFTSSDGDSPSSTSTRDLSIPATNNPSPMRGKKTKAAPPPPLPTSMPPAISYDAWKDPKDGKDEANRTTRGMMSSVSPDESNPYDEHHRYTDKSSQGKWKRKKGPAPARPIPHRRKLKVLSLKDVKLELDEIEMQQQGLEKQGVRLEQLIRDRAENGSSNQEASLQMDVEELVLELFVLVNEKNELFRRQAELMLLRRQQRLEEEHADIEYQIRCLLCQPEATKTDFDKQREETLIQRLVEIVERRNEIVECLEMDRRREIEEDRSINTRMGIYTAKSKGEFGRDAEASAEERCELKKPKKTKLKDKAREKIMRKVHKKDADKDVDEAEVKLKRQNKKKWF